MDLEVEALENREIVKSDREVMATGPTGDAADRIKRYWASTY
jgi:hypothetical protein